MPDDSPSLCGEEIDIESLEIYSIHPSEASSSSSCYSLPDHSRGHRRRQPHKSCGKGTHNIDDSKPDSSRHSSHRPHPAYPHNIHGNELVSLAMPRCVSPTSSDGPESYWAHEYRPSTSVQPQTRSRSCNHQQVRHRSLPRRTKASDEYPYYREVGGDDYYESRGRTRESYPRDGASYDSYYDQHSRGRDRYGGGARREADRQNRRSKRGGDWLLLACATTVAAAFYLFADGKKKKQTAMARPHMDNGSVGHSHGRNDKRSSSKSRSKPRVPSKSRRSRSIIRGGPDNAKA